MINYHVTGICLHSILDGLDIESPLDTTISSVFHLDVQKSQKIKSNP